MSAKQADSDPAWAIWVPEGEEQSGDRVVAVEAPDEDAAIEKAKSETDWDGAVSHVDGPYEGSEAAVFEFEFVTEHRETVVVEAPGRDYAEETADLRRDYRGEYVQDVHTEVTRRRKSTEEDPDA